MYNVRSINQGTDRPVNLLRKNDSPAPTSARRNNISELFRKKIKIDESKLNGIKFQIAETQKDLLAAYKIVHDVYVAEGYMDPHPTGLRVTQYHALPLTTTFIGKIDGNVVLTMSLIPDSTLGLPMDSKYRQELDALRKQNRYLAEVGNLASSPSFRNNDQNVPMHGNKIMHTYASKYLWLDDLVVTINPKHRWFYEHILLFEQIGEEKQYEFVKGAPAIAMRLDLRTAQQRYAAVYDGLAIDKDLHSFFFVTDSECIHLAKQQSPVNVDDRKVIEAINSCSVHQEKNFNYHIK